MSRNPYIKNIQPYKLSSHKAWEMEPEQVLKLDWNEATIPPSPKVLQALKDYVQKDHLHWYPDTLNSKLIQLLAGYAGVEDLEVQYFAGSDSAQEYITRCFLVPGEVVTLVSPTYDNFRVAAESQGARITRFQTEFGKPLDTDALINHMFEHNTAMLYLVNPNNPTGTVVPLADIERILKEVPECFCIIDEAYFEFGGISSASLVSRYENIIITRTFSKAFSLASLRIGYVVSCADNIKLLDRIRNAKMISMPAQLAAIAALEDLAYSQAFVEQVALSKVLLMEELKKLGFRAFAGGGNYTLIDLGDSLVKAKLIGFLKERNIFVRDLAHIPGLENFMRISLGPPEMMQRVINVIAEFVAKK